MTLLFPFFDDTTRFISPGHTAASPKMSERTLNFWCFGGYACWRYWLFGMEFLFLWGVQWSGLANDFDDVAIVVVGQEGNCP
jgi:hypothetical protein